RPEYINEYESWMYKAKELEEGKKIQCQFHFGTFFLPYLYYIASELLGYPCLSDKRINSKGLMQTAMQGLISELVTISAKVLVQEVKRKNTQNELGTGGKSEQ